MGDDYDAAEDAYLAGEHLQDDGAWSDPAVRRAVRESVAEAADDVLNPERPSESLDQKAARLTGDPSSSAPGSRFVAELLGGATCVLAAEPLQDEDLRQVALFRRFLTDRKAIQDRYAAQIEDLRRRRQADIAALINRYGRDAGAADSSSSAPAGTGSRFPESAGEVR